LPAHTADRWPAPDLVTLGLPNGPEVTGGFPLHHRLPRRLSSAAEAPQRRYAVFGCNLSTGSSCSAMVASPERPLSPSAACLAVSVKVKFQGRPVLRAKIGHWQQLDVSGVSDLRASIAASPRGADVQLEASLSSSAADVCALLPASHRGGGPRSEAAARLNWKWWRFWIGSASAFRPEYATGRLAAPGPEGTAGCRRAVCDGRVARAC
jgi:hypothetical protein